MKNGFAMIRALRLLALLAVALGVSHAQSVTTSGCLSLVTEDDNPCPVSYAITIAPDGGSIDTFASAGGDDLDASFEVQIYLTVAGPGVSDAGGGDQEVDLEDALPINAQGTYVASANIEACEGINGAVDGPGEGGGCYTFSAYVSMLATVPNVTSVSASSLAVGTSGTITLYGTTFIPTQFPAYNSVTPITSNSGVTFTVSGPPSSGQATLQYSVAANAPTGQFTVGLRGLFGEGTQQTITVVDPAPTVSSVSPSSWNSGTTTAITIYGSGFGTHPSVTIAGPGVASYSVTGVTDTQVTANVTVSPLVAAKTATLQVQSNGYTSSGFLGNPGQPSSSWTTATLVPSVPSLQILLFKSPITGPVIAGQKMSLTLAQPTGLTILSSNWSSDKFPENLAINGWAPGPAPSYPISPPTYTTSTSTSNNAPFNFFWIAGGSFTVNCGWTLQDSAGGQAPGNSNYTFTVTAPPPPPTVTVAKGSLILAPLNDSSLATPMIEQGGINTVTLWGLTDSFGGTAGVTFQPQSPTTTSPAGAYFWTQVLNEDTMQYLEPPDPVVNPTGNESCSLRNPPLLDNDYPNPLDPNTAMDSDRPSFDLTGFNAFSRAFSATTTLLWAPKADPVCIAANNLVATGCTVPLPQGSVSWGFGTSVINNLGINPSMNGTTIPWIFDSAQCVANNFWAGQFAASSAYPNWNGVSINGDRGKCTPQ